jgi:uncharacterized protein DUF4258
MGPTLRFAMTDQILRRGIARVAVDSSRVLFSRHARMRMQTRKVTTTQVLRALRLGYVVEPAHRNIRGNWQCTLEARLAGDRVRVAAALLTDTDGEWVMVVTVMN